MKSRNAQASSINISKVSRDLAIDRLRGSLVILMVAGDFLGGINWVPAFLKHAPDIGFTIADTVAPAFVFVIGLNFKASFTRRYISSRPAAYRHFLTRYLSLIGVGAIITAGSAFFDRPTGWGVLESLGIAGLLTLLFIQLPTWSRVLIGMTLLVGYQYLLDNWMLESVVNTGHGGLFGAISWSALLLLSTAVGDFWRRGFGSYVLCTAALVVTATVSCYLVPISKNRVSLSYILLTLTISALAFLVVKVLANGVAEKAGFLSWWGQSALAMYLLHLLLLSLFGLPPVAWWYVDSPVWLAVLQLCVIIAIMSLAAKRLHTRKTRPS